MFKIGDKVVYGQTGVCIVTDICAKEFIKNQKREYYLLKPLGVENNIIYAPVEDGKIFMRHIISKSEAESLIENIPQIVEGLPDEEITKEDYIEKINSHTLEDLIQITSAIYYKKLDIEKAKKRLNLVDERYMKISESLLFGELSAALEIPYNEVPKYIEKIID